MTTATIIQCGFRGDFMKKYDVDFQGNWMQLILSKDRDEEEWTVLRSVSDMDRYNSDGGRFSTKTQIRLYAESDETDEDALYEELKAAIIEQAEEEGIDPDSLSFYYD